MEHNDKKVFLKDNLFFSVKPGLESELLFDNNGEHDKVAVSHVSNTV